MPLMKTRSPQLSLRLDAELPDPAACWADGARLPFLGGHLLLKLDTDRTIAVRENQILHLPLPPAATKRQIQDGAEAWLRQEAALIIGASWPSDAGHNYDEISQHGFSARLLDVADSPTLIPE